MMCAEDEKAQATLKIRFLTAVCKGELGSVTDEGVVITLDEFRDFFPDITSGYVESFLPAATLEPGRTQMTPSKFIFRSQRGVYRVHPDVFGGQGKQKKV